jgi:branched-chain amino acid transport system ATP-binding protein
MPPLLQCKSLTKKFGGLVALEEFSCEINEKEIVGLIGPNGSGKSTLLNLIVGMYPPTSGNVAFEGNRITGLAPHKIIHLGIAKTNQIPKPFLTLTIFENVMMGGIFGRKMDKGEVIENTAKILQFVGLWELREEQPSKLTGVQLKLLELARALNTQPKLLLLDELAAGVSELEMRDARLLIERLNKEWGMTIVWVEHIMDAVSKSCQRLICLNEGRKIAEGSVDEVLKNEVVVKAYIGE